MPPDAENLTAIECELEELERLDLNGLRAFWAARWGLPPKLRSVALLRYMIAWRLQSGATAGLDPATKDLLRRTTVPRAPRPPNGARLTREYRGVLHHVEVAADTFHYHGRSYGSLSEIAREITGARWNGPRFFGLRPKAVS